VLKVENIIVGAGPYGLSISSHFRADKIEHLVVGRPMSAWQDSMPLGMILKSEPFASNLSAPEHSYTLESFHRSRGTSYKPIGSPVSLEDFLAYGHWFRQQTGVEVVDATLTNLVQESDGFHLSFADGSLIWARRVILATGYLAYWQMPPVLQGFSGELISHSSVHRNLSKFSRKDVTIVGRGQSALETAALLHELGANVRVLARAANVIWADDPNVPRSVFKRLRYPEAALGPGWRSLIVSELPRVFRQLPAQTRHDYVLTSWGPFGGWWLKERVVGRVPLLTSHTIARVVERGGRLRLTVQGPEKMVEVETDHVITGTGYQVDLGRLQYLDPSLQTRIKTFERVPVLDQAFQSSVPGLHFVGVTSAQSFGPVMRFAYGSKHAATFLTRHLRKSTDVRSYGVRGPSREAATTQSATAQSVSRRVLTRADTGASDYL
jgi:cation diffusion facilitator CzcD-associated flavoprotein CzcO